MVWRSKSEDDRALALIDVDGMIGEITGNCREQMALAYDGTWGYCKYRQVGRRRLLTALFTGERKT
jgi:hypothetical protein